MIETTQYRIVFKRPDITKEEASDGDIFNAKWKARRAEVSDYITRQASAYDAVENNEYQKSHLVIAKCNETISAILDVTSSAEFKSFLKDQQHELMPIIESASGMQLMVMAAFVPSPHQSNIGWSLNTPLVAMEFWRVSHGVNPGKAITQVEAAARVEMNDRLFDKIAKALEGVKRNHPDYQIEVQEKQVGSFFVQVTSKDNKEGGVSSYDVTSALQGLTSDPDVAAVLAGPKLYPSDIEALRQKNASIPPVPRQPKKLDM